MRLLARIFACVGPFVGVFAGAVMFGAPGALGAILTPADMLVVTFTTAAGAAPTPDVFTLNLGTVQVLAPHTSRTGAMYDGATLLGVGSTSSFGGHVGALSLSPARTWRSPTSVFTFGEPAITDFTPIVNGTNNGRIEFTIATGAMDITLSNVSIRMGRAFGPSAFENSFPQPVMTSVQIVPIPEPGITSIAAVACGAILAARRSASRRSTSRTSTTIR